MANIASQKKRNRQNEKRRQRNVAVRSELKTRIKAVQTSATGDGDGLDDKLVLAQRRLDKAATKGVIHKNQAARRTSRLMKAANKHDS